MIEKHYGRWLEEWYRLAMLVFLAERLPGIPHRQCSQSQRHQRTGPVKETSVILQKSVKERFEEKLEGEIEVAYVLAFTDRTGSSDPCSSICQTP